MTNAIISRLTKIGSIDRVVPFTTMEAYRESEKSSSGIAAELGVTHLLEGHVQKSGDSVKIILRLIDGEADTYDWSEDYKAEWDISALFEMQANVAEQVARNMDVAVSGVELESIHAMPTTSKEAYNLFLQAEYQSSKFNRTALENAILLYEKAIALDSTFTEAYIGLGNTWDARGWWGYYNEREAIMMGRDYLHKALAIDPDNEKVADQLYACHFIYDWDFERIEPYYQRLLTENTLYKWPMMIDYSNKTGRLKEAYKSVEKAIMENPTDGSLYWQKANILFRLSEGTKALHAIENATPLFQDSWWFKKEKARIYFYLGEFNKSQNLLTELEVGASDFPANEIIMLKAIYSQMEGNLVNKNMYLKKLMQNYNKELPGSPAWYTALYYSAVNDDENAFTWLQRSYDRHEPEITWLNAEPLLERLRADPRFRDLFQKMGFSKVIHWDQTNAFSGLMEE